MKELRGVILAAGVGSRLRPLTSNKPKCLVKVHGKALLDYQLDSYKSAGISEVFIVVGYEAEAIREHCKHIKDIDIHIVESVDYESTNNMYSLYLLKDRIKGHPFILNNADLAIDQDIIPKLVEDERADLIAVDNSQYNDESMKVEVASDGRIIDISKVIPQTKSFGCSIDYYKFSSKSSETLFEEIDRYVEVNKDRKQWTEVALQSLLNNGRLAMEPLLIGNTRWVEVDNYEDLGEADIIFSNFDLHFTNIDSFFLDLDGTIYLGDSTIEGGAEFVKKMREKGKKIYFLSNNSSKDKSQYVSKLKSLNIDTNEDSIILSTDGLAQYLHDNKIRSVHVLGTTALENRLKDEGFNTDTSKPEFVVIGYDTELTYEKLAKACSFINAGTDILATHRDVTCPTENGPIPDVGALLEMIKLTTGKIPIKIFGKPEPEMITHILKRDGTSPERAAVIGDRMYTDLVLAQNLGSKSILVLSGETTRDDVETIETHPDICVPSVASFV